MVVGCDNYGYIGKNFFTNIFFGKCGDGEYYLNAGTYIGYAKDLKDIISKIYELNPTDAADDQVLMIKYYNEHPGEIHIDNECKLFLVLSYPLIEVDYFTSITINNNKLHAIDYKSMPFFIHAPGNGFLNNIIIKLGYGTPDSDVKKNLTYAMAYKLCYHLKRLFIDYKYIFLSIIVILVVISFTMTKNIIKKKSIISIKNKKNKT